MGRAVNSANTAAMLVQLNQANNASNLTFYANQTLIAINAKADSDRTHHDQKFVYRVWNWHLNLLAGPLADLNS